MALEYMLELAVKQSPDEVLNILSSLGFDLRSLTGVTITAAYKSDLGREIIKEAYQFDPTVCLIFRLDKFEGWETGLHTTIKATLELLRKIGADGILLFNGETPVLMNINGVLTLNNAYDFWDQPSLLSLVNRPYEMRPIASL